MNDKKIEEMENDINETLKHNAVIDIINGGYIGLNTEGMARELYDDGYRRQSELTPCDVCRFNPPSSADGKPCSVCPAQAKGGAE